MVSFTGFHWDEHNRSHIARHNIKPSEVEEVMRNGSIIYLEEERNGEQRIMELGHTIALRVLFVVWTPRGTRIRPVTAFDPPRDLSDEYLAQLFEPE